MILVHHSAKVHDLSFPLLFQFVFVVIPHRFGLELVVGLDLRLYHFAFNVILNVCLFALQTLEFSFAVLLLFNLTLRLKLTIITT